VLGVGTTFTTDYSAKDFMDIDGGPSNLHIESVDSDTVITLYTSTSTVLNDVAHYLRKAYEIYAQLPAYWPTDNTGTVIPSYSFNGWPYVTRQSYDQFRCSAVGDFPYGDPPFSESPTLVEYRGNVTSGSFNVNDGNPLVPDEAIGYGMKWSVYGTGDWTVKPNGDDTRRIRAAAVNDANDSSFWAHEWSGAFKDIEWQTTTSGQLLAFYVEGITIDV
jgi:hypothetical protein